jgi:hypothetical protein
LYRDTFITAAGGGHLEILKYAHDYAAHGMKKLAQRLLVMDVWRSREHGCPWDEATFAASQGHFIIVKYAHENGCPWNEGTCSTAAKNGHLEMLTFPM